MINIARQHLAILVSGAFLCLQTAVAVTADYPYEFNSVAITGGGYITGIIGHPREKNLLYTRTDIGSSYRWDESANKWIPLTDFINATDANLFGTESVALDPTDPNRLYLAQGRYTGSKGAFFVSEDRGATFQQYPAPFDMGSNDMGRNNGERLAVNPFNTRELWMGTRTAGLMKSTNRAQTWTNITSFPNAFANGIGIVFVIFDPEHEGTIYVGACIPGGLYYTTDSGKTWESLPGQPTTWNQSLLWANYTPQSTGPQPMKGALASNGKFYVTYSDAPGPWGVDYGEVWVFDTVSKVWIDITPRSANVYPRPYKPQAWPPGGFCGLSIDSKSPDTLIVVTLDRDPGPAIDSMYLSKDGGISWLDVAHLSSPDDADGFWGHPIEEAKLDNETAVPWLSFNWGTRWGGFGAPSPVVGLTKFGWWMSAVLIDPTNSEHILYGTGATMWATDSISRVESHRAPEWYIQAQGIEETVNLAMISPTEGAHLLTGMGDINGFRHDDLDVPQPMLGTPVYADGYSLDWAGRDPKVIVRTGSYGIDVLDACGQACYSTDGGNTWNFFGTCIPGVDASTYNSGTLVVDASGEYFVWASGDASESMGPYATKDHGATWVAPSGLVGQTVYFSSDKAQPKTFYAFTESTWYISTNGGFTYDASNATDVGLPNYSGAAPIPSYATEGDIWLALGSLGLYHTTNFGANWTRIGPYGLTADLVSLGAPAPGLSWPAVFIQGTAFSSGALNAYGIYRSDDCGTSWVRVDDDQHQYGGVGLIQGDPRVHGRIYLGTGGRGIIYADTVKGRNTGHGNIPGTGGI